MAGQTIALNQVQKIPGTALNVTNLNQTPPNDILYTCPANKKAKFKGSVNSDGFGAGTECEINVNGTLRIANMVTVGVPVDVPETSLSAGDTINLEPDAGTNADIEVTLTIEETPA